MNPYLPIRKVPLDYQGIQSSAYSVQMSRPDKEGRELWKEAGIVGHKYLLIPNEEVKNAAEEVASEITFCNLKHNKTFFDGKRYVYSMISDYNIGEVQEGDDVALGLQFWNSYDGSRALGYSIMLYRLVCLNGMMSNQAFQTYRFKHDPTGEQWDEGLDTIVANLNSISHGSEKLDSFISNCKKLAKLEVTTDVLGDIRHKNIHDIPVGLWGQIVDRFTRPNNEDGTTGWGLLNASTDVLWHKDKPTIASYKQNADIVDGLCRAVA